MTIPKQKRSGYQRDPFDFYCEPSWCTELLASVVDFDQTITWDPAAGSGTIPRTLQKLGLIAIGSDIVDRTDGRLGTPLVDFLNDDPPFVFDNICVNPPYKHAEAFVRRGLELRARRLAVLVRLDFLASQRRHALFTEHEPQFVQVLSRRPSMPPGPIDPAVTPKGGQHDYGWIVWDSFRRRHARCEVRWLK